MLNRNIKSPFDEIKRDAYRVSYNGQHFVTNAIPSMAWAEAVTDGHRLIARGVNLYAEVLSNVSLYPIGIRTPDMETLLDKMREPTAVIYIEARAAAHLHGLAEYARKAKVFGLYSWKFWATDAGFTVIESKHGVMFQSTEAGIYFDGAPINFNIAYVASFVTGDEDIVITCHGNYNPAHVCGLNSDWFGLLMPIVPMP